MSSFAKGVVICLGVLFLIGIIGFTASNQLISQNDGADNRKTARRVPVTWKSMTSVDRMHRTKSTLIYQESLNGAKGWLALEFPELVINCSRGKVRDVYINNKMASSVENADGEHTVRLKFDDSQPVTELWRDSLDHKALFSNNPQGFIGRALRSEDLMYEFTPFQASSKQSVSFMLDGLEDELAKAKSDCGILTKAYFVKKAQDAERIAQKLQRERSILRSRVEPHVRHCSGKRDRAETEKWCWSDPSDQFWSSHESQPFLTHEEAVSEAMRAAERGEAFRLQ